MTTRVQQPKENVLDGRGLLLVGLVGAFALGVLVLSRGLGEQWSWALFGAVFFGGQNLAIVGRSGGFRRRPLAAYAFLAGAICAGALLGFLVHP